VRYDVVIVGFRLNASLKPAQALQLVLGMDAETSKELTRRFPAAVLSGVSLSRAERVSGELTDAGAKVEVRESRLSLANDGGTGAPARGGGNASPAERPAIIAELPDGSRRAPPHTGRHEEASGNYEIGEILAPLGRGGTGAAPAPATQAPTPVTRRASREELDQALRDSLRPDQAATETPEPASTPVAPPGKGEKGKAVPAPEAFELMDNSAFAGMQNFGGGLDGFAEADDAPKLQVDEVALRSIQRRPEADVRAASEQSALAARLGSWWSDVSGSALEWGAALLSLLVVTGITLLAVGYALDPEHMLRPIGLEALPAGAKKLFADLFGG
jgi:hypothetical protein